MMTRSDLWKRIEADKREIEGLREERAVALARAERAEAHLVKEQQVSRAAIAELGSVKARLAMAMGETGGRDLTPGEELLHEVADLFGFDSVAGFTREELLDAITNTQALVDARFVANPRDVPSSGETTQG